MMQMMKEQRKTLKKITKERMKITRMLTRDTKKKEEEEV